VLNPLKILTISSILCLNGCSTFIDSPIGIPPRPHLISLTPEIQQQIHTDALDIIAVNDLALKTHIKKLESRIRLHDESL